MGSKYTVKAIYDPEFGCEGRQDGCVPMAEVVLASAGTTEFSMKVPDSYLYDNNINEGDEILLNGEKGTIEKLQKE